MIVAACLAVVPYATTLAQSNADPVIMTVAGVDVPRSEFEYSYNKNNTDGVIDKKTVEEYVELFVNYKLKVQAALDARLDTMADFRKEFAQYRDQQVLPTFVTEADMLEVALSRKLHPQQRAGEGNRRRLGRRFWRSVQQGQEAIAEECQHKEL